MSEPTASTTRIGDFVLPAAATARPAPAAAVAATVTEPAPRPLMEAMPAPAPMPTPAAMPAPSLSIDTADADGDITDLPEGDLTEATILQALVRKPSAGLVECPIKPPACPAAMLTVARDRRLVLLAVTRKGLLDLRAIATAYRWVIENRPLLSMALPQFSIDTHALPGLRLLVDRADAQADLLLPMTENKNVTVQTYRKLRWAGKTGLLLEAA